MDDDDDDDDHHDDTRIDTLKDNIALLFLDELISFSFGIMVVIVCLYLFVFSKVKRRLEKRPPKRSTICTTPRFLMKKKGKVPNKGPKGEKQAAGGEQKGESGSETAVQQQKGEKKTKRQGVKKRNKTQKEGGKETHKKASGAKLKK